MKHRTSESNMQREHSMSRVEQTRSRLWKSAAEEFASNGPDKARVSDIVRKAGVTQPTFYEYFETKDRAYFAMVDEFRKRLKLINEALLLANVPSSLRLTDRVANSLKTLLDFLAEDPALTQIGLFQEAAAPGSRTILAKSIASNIAQEQKAGLVRPDISADRIGLLYVGMIEHLAREGGGAKRRSAQAWDCARILCEGLDAVSR